MVDCNLRATARNHNNLYRTAHHTASRRGQEAQACLPAHRRPSDRRRVSFGGDTSANPERASQNSIAPRARRHHTNHAHLSARADRVLPARSSPPCKRAADLIAAARHQCESCDGDIVESPARSPNHRPRAPPHRTPTTATIIHHWPLLRALDLPTPNHRVALAAVA